MRRSSEFSSTITKGCRSGTRRVVVHYRAGSTRAEVARVGFVVSKAVGNAVERNLVKRRLRAIVREDFLAGIDGAAVVIRALPAAQEASFEELRADLNSAWTRAERKLSTQGRSASGESTRGRVSGPGRGGNQEQAGGRR